MVRKRNPEGLGRSPEPDQVFFQEVRSSILRAQGFKKAVSIKEAPVIDGHPGLGQGRQFFIQPDKLGFFHNPLQLHQISSCQFFSAHWPLATGY